MSAPYTPKAEMTWRLDPEVEAARRLPGWAEFHRACGAAGVFYDHIERESGKRSDYVATAFGVTPRGSVYVSHLIAKGRGKTPLEAVLSAASQVSIDMPGSEEAAKRMLGQPANDDVDDFAEFVTPPAPVDDNQVDDFEELL
jgi:hypothetical protein